MSNLKQIPKNPWDTPTAKSLHFRKKHPVLFPLIIFVLLMLALSPFTQMDNSPTIALIKIEGPIMDSDLVLQQIQEISKLDHIKGVLVRINSPGGAVSPSQEIFTELVRLKETKPVYTSISTLGASGGYYIAMAGEKVFAMPGSLTGSIGVIMQGMNMEKLFKKIGLEPITLKAGANKDLGNSSRPMTASERKLLNELLQDTHQQFIADLLSQRKLEEAKIPMITDGRVFTGRQALKLGLIDEFKTYTQAVETLKKDLQLPSDSEIYHPENPAEDFFSAITAQSMLRLWGKYNQVGLYSNMQNFTE